MPGRYSPAMWCTNPFSTQRAIRGVTCGAITVTSVAERSTASIFCSATAPPPTTSTFSPSSFRKMGYSDMASGLYSAWRSSGRRIALHRSDCFAGQERSQIVFRVPRKEPAQIFAGVALRRVAREQALNRLRNLVGHAAVANGPAKTGVFAYVSAQAEVVGVFKFAADFDFFAFEANIGKPVLTTAVRASRHVQLDLLLESGQPLFQFFHQPARKRFGFRDGQFAKL